MNHMQLTELMGKMIPARMPVMITGKPGVGKTDSTETVTASINYDLILTHPVVNEPVDYKGLPMPNGALGLATEATFLPFGELSRAINATRPTVWFFDDLGQASPSVQAACMQLFLARRVNGHVLPDCITFVAASNRRVDRAGVSGILEPVKSRFVTIVELEPDIDSWCMWAYAHNIPATLIAFLRYRPELLCQFQATADLTNSPVPRTWSHLAKLESLGLSAPVEAEAMNGAVGSGAAGEYLAFRQMFQSLVNLDAILLDPDKAKIPTNTSELYATAVGLAGRANRGNFARIATYATRLAVEADRGEFAVLLVRDAQRRDPDVQYSDAYVRMQCGPIGKLISGRE
jgi:hypothetical protein